MLYAIVVVLVLIADQLVKYWVTANITLNSGSVELIPGILKLVNIHNDGAAFSLFPGYRWIFVGLAAAVTIAVILALIFHWIKSGFGRWMAVLTMAGALGNAIDRAIYGYVVDMFVIEPVKFIQVFNVADIFITVGGILFGLFIISLPVPVVTRFYEEGADIIGPVRQTAGAEGKTCGYLSSVAVPAGFDIAGP